MGETEKRVAGYGEGRSIAYGFCFFLLVGYLSFVIMGRFGVAWFGLVCELEVEVDLHLRSFEAFSFAISLSLLHVVFWEVFFFALLIVSI